MGLSKELRALAKGRAAEPSINLSLRTWFMLAAKDLERKDAEIAKLRAALNEVLKYMATCEYPCDLAAAHFRQKFGIDEQQGERDG